MTMRPERCTADRRTVPSAGLPAAMRASGVSRPWSIALRIMWVSGSARRSMTVLSTSVFSPSVTRRTDLPVMSATSRTIRDMRWNTDFTGCARIAITLSWISRVSCSSSSRPMMTPEAARSPPRSRCCASMAWLMTSSPTRLMRRSTRSRSTRMVGVAPAARRGLGSCGGSGRWCFLLLAARAGAAAAKRWRAGHGRQLLGLHGRPSRRRRRHCGPRPPCVSGGLSVEQGKIERDGLHRQLFSRASARCVRLWSSLISRSQSHSTNSKTCADGVLALLGREPDLPGEIGAFGIELSAQAVPDMSQSMLISPTR